MFGLELNHVSKRGHWKPNNETDDIRRDKGHKKTIISHRESILKNINSHNIIRPGDDLWNIGCGKYYFC